MAFLKIAPQNIDFTPWLYACQRLFILCLSPLNKLATTKMKHFLGWLFGAMFLVQCQPQLPPTVEQEIDRRVQQSISPSLSMGILWPSGQVQYYNYGQTQPNGQHMPTQQTLYEIGSVTKTLTAALVVQYFAEALDQPIRPYLQQAIEVDSNWAPITIKALLNHQSGLPRLSDQFAPDNWSDPFQGYSDRLLWRDVQASTPQDSAHWQYSNLGYALLGKILERQTGQDFETLLQPLLDRTGMTHTLLQHPIKTTPLFATPTQSGAPNAHWHFTGPSRYAGGLLSCAEDLMAYLKYQCATNPLFQEAPIEALIPTGLDEFGVDQLFYKNGWLVFQPTPEAQVVFHNGRTGGFSAFIGYHKTTKMGVVMLSNSIELIDDLALKLMVPSVTLRTPQRTIAYELAEAIQNQSDLDLVETYRRLKATGQSDDLIHLYWLERFHFGQGHFKTSLALSEILAAALSDDWEVLYIYGQNLEQLQRYRDALVAYQKAFALHPTHPTLQKAIDRCKEAAD